MALKFLASASDLLQRSYYRRGNQVIASRNIFKRKCNIKYYYLSYYYVINFNVYKIESCCKNQLKIFENVLKRKLFINIPQRFSQHFNKSFHYWYFEFCQCLLTLPISEKTNLAGHTVFNPSFVSQVICNKVIFAWWKFPSEKKPQNTSCANHIQNMRAMLITILLKPNSPECP